jgi:hypothetical protein
MLLALRVLGRRPWCAKDMRLLRTAAIFSDLAFITYGTMIEWLAPVLFLHLLRESRAAQPKPTVLSVPKLCANLITGRLGGCTGALPRNRVIASMCLKLKALPAHALGDRSPLRTVS